MLTGLYAVRDLLLGEKQDLWSVNADKSYHEQVSEKEQREQQSAGPVETGSGQQPEMVMAEEKS